MNRISIAARLALVSLGTAWLGSAVAASPDDLVALDVDRDGVINRDDAHIDASAAWNVISPEWYLQTEYLHSQPATLKEHELVGRVDAADYARINLNDDHGIDMIEWLKAVDGRFAAADRNGDGVISKDELATPEGERLLHVLE